MGISYRVWLTPKLSAASTICYAFDGNGYVNGINLRCLNWLAPQGILIILI